MWSRPLSLLAVASLLACSLLLAGCQPITSGAKPAASGGVTLEEGFRTPPREARPSVYWLWLNGFVNRDHIEQELRAYYDAGIRGVCIFDMGARGDEQASPPAGPPFMSAQSVNDVAHAARVAQQLGIDVQLSVSSSWDMGGTWVEPRHASMGLYHSELLVEGPTEFDEILPRPPVPSAAPRNADGQPVFRKRVAVLALPAAKRLPGHDFIFQLDPPELHELDYCRFYNSGQNPTSMQSESHFTKDFSIAVSTSDPTDEAFDEVLYGSLIPTTEAQQFQLPTVPARYIRLRLLNGHNQNSNRLQLGEFELYDQHGINIAASHVADRSRNGAALIGSLSVQNENGDWAAANIHDGAHSGPADSWSSDGKPPLVVDEPDAIVDLSDRIRPDGRLKWTVPEGNWVIIAFDCMNTGERLKVPSPNSDGLATDHLSPQATRAYLTYLIDRLESELGILGQTSLKQLYLASYEVRGPIWTPELPKFFQQYRGYDMLRYLPVLGGNILVNDEVTQRFIYDYRKTLGELLVDAYYRVAVEMAHQAGIGIESEAGGPGPPIHQVPVDALQALGSIDEVRGEFWPKRPDADRLWVVKETACAAHIYGKRRVHMEAFTSMHHWQDGPVDLKLSVDRAFCEGANHIVWHTASHLPPEAGKPGWVYHAGTHLNSNLVWWPKAKPFIDYLARCSFLLQQGVFVGDICYYYGDQGYNFVSAKQVDPSAGFGYDYDVTNREVILSRMGVENSRVTLPNGLGYEVLVLPNRRDIDLDVLKKIEQLVKTGATVVGPKPTASTGLSGHPERNSQVREIANRLWGQCDGKSILEQPYGQGRIIWGRSVREVLLERGVIPDFSFVSPNQATDLDFIHRRTEKADIYFIRNKRASWEHFEATFRVNRGVPELWEPDTGAIKSQHTFHATPEGTETSLQLSPHGSVFVVFRTDAPRLTPLKLEQPDLSEGVRRAYIDSWDGQHARVTTFQSGKHQLTTGDGRSVEFSLESAYQPVTLEGKWEVRFDEGSGAPPPVQFDDLMSWTEHTNQRIRYFSGIAEYQKEFELPASWLLENRRVFLDLGDLWAVGEVYVNEQPLGVLWKPPFVVDITSSATAGRNCLKVQIANTWSNRLVGDARQATEPRLTRTNVLSSNGTPWEDLPLLRSGLFGPVRLFQAEDVNVTLP